LQKLSSPAPEDGPDIRHKFALHKENVHYLHSSGNFLAITDAGLSRWHEMCLM